VLLTLLLLAWALRLPPLLDSPLHPDEALYGYWGLLIGRGRDPWLTSGPVYKPPLLPYLISAFQLLLGDTTIALRIAGAGAGLLTVSLTAALTHALYGDRWSGAMAAVAVALSPFAVTFSGTAFPDPLMVVFGLGACLAAARDDVRWAGLLGGLSFATKQTGLVWFPLLLGITLARSKQPKILRELSFFYLTPIALAFAWDGVRVALGADSFWSAGVVGYGGLRLIWSHELWPRFRAWTRWMASLFGSPVVNALLLASLPVLVWHGLIRQPGTRRVFFDLLLTGFCMVFALVHWLAAFPIWARYLLPLVPIAAILLGRVVRVVASLWKTGVKHPVLSSASVALLVVLLIVPAGEASAGRSALAREGAAYRGIDEVIAFFSGLPEGSVVYHHWLGWHYHYALFDAPVYLAYWPTPAWLARDVQAFGGQDPRYIAFPPEESEARVKHALEAVGYRLQPVLLAADAQEHASFLVCRIVPSPAP
jgi:4-amino-4-deoxy-L-arabinose transferase-like glycosyltransferase